MSNSAYIGNKVRSVDIGEELNSITRVTLFVDSDHVYTAGNDTGRAIEKEVPWASQEMANAVLSKLSGVTTKPFSAEQAMISPAFEIGDAVTVGGVYSQILGEDINYGVSGLVDIYSPNIDEIEDEYPAEKTQQSSIIRELARTRSSISKTADGIRMEVFGEDGYTGSSIVAQLGLIIDRVTGKIGEDEATSLIKTALEGIEISISNNTAGTSASITLSYTDDDSTKIDIASGTINLTGLVTISSLENGTTEIDGGCIKTNSLTAEALHLSGLLTVYSGRYSYGEEVVGGYIGYDSGFNGAKGIGIRSKEELSQVVCTDAAARISYGDLYGISQVVCSPSSVLVEGLNLIQMATYGITRLNVDSEGIYPSGANYTCGTAALPWKDVYAAGTSFSALVARVEALEK